MFQKAFGACMADDMGLGKTIQVISLILKMKRRRQIEKAGSCNLSYYFDG